MRITIFFTLLLFLSIASPGQQNDKRYDHQLKFHVDGKTKVLYFVKNGDSLDYKLRNGYSLKREIIADSVTIPFNYYQQGHVQNIFFNELHKSVSFDSSNMQRFVKKTERKSERCFDMIRYYYANRKNRIFTPYESNYFTFYDFTHQDDTTLLVNSMVKFQVSFKYDFFNYAVKNKLFFATTIKAFWDLYDGGNSNPVKEVNLKPALWHEYFLKTPEYYVNIYSIATGVYHESNGQQEFVTGTLDTNILDRGWNRWFTRAKFIIDFQKSYFWTGFTIKELVIEPTYYWYTFGASEQSKDIQGYYGDIDLRVDLKAGSVNTRFLHNTGYNFSFYWRPQIKQGKFSEIMVEAKIGPWDMNFINYSLPFIFIQYRQGYGEGLVNYNRYQESFRAGISLNLE